jgi:class 3 adenylate cyclase/tetratricopeptide (TPR) repeat protein
MLVRKTVTVLFSDVTEFTVLGERLDPESLRHVMSRYFDEMAAVITHHGGTIEKFIGDEVMAVFGVPVVHEDDALRAVRAAADMRHRLEELNRELEDAWGVRLQARTGVNTGEVVAGDPSTGSGFVTGDTVNLAKRLEQAAGPGEILIGKATYPLVKDAVTAGPLQSFSVKGKRDPVSPLLLEEVEEGAPGLARRLDAPLIDRVLELAAIEETFDRVEAEPALHLVTVLGAAGIGKSRLAAEAVASIGGRGRTLTGRCLPYGEGITFWPIVELLRSAGGEAGISAALEGVEDADLVTERLRGVLGATSAISSEETFWAIRRFLEALARERPLLVVFEDIHWAEPTFLDLIEYLAGWTRRAGILILCLARRELLDMQPTWVSPRENALVITLEPLSSAEAEALLEGLRAESTLTDRAVERISIAAEGNPLFIEQLVAMAVENGGGNGDLHIPPSIHALLSERLDRLSTDERVVIERAAVIGKEFLRSEVIELCPPELKSTVGPILMTLVRKELIRPDTSAAARDDGLRFRHVLIRDAAYEGLPKEVRAELHERFSAMLEESFGGRLSEVEEIVGYHLEQAFRCRSELGRQDEATAALARHAGKRLAAAGRRALARADIPAAVNLLKRASDLLSGKSEEEGSVLLALGAALREQGDPLSAESVLTQAAAAAEAAGDEGLGLRVLIERSVLRMYLDPEVGADEALEVAERVTPVFEASGDELGLSRAWSLVAEAHWMRSRFAAMEEVLERALEYAERVGDRREVSWILGAMARVALVGPRPVEAGIERCLELRKRARGEPSVQPVVDSMLAALEAMRGRFSEARERYASSRTAVEELGLKVRFAQLGQYAGIAELIAGDPAAAERELRPGYEAFEEMGEQAYLSTTAALLARAVYLQGRFDEAERLTETSEQAASEDDLVSQVMWRGTRAKVLAGQHEAATAEQLARQGVSLARQTDFANMLADALVDLAETLMLLGRQAEAAAPIDEAIQIYDAKGNVVSSRATAALRDKSPSAVLDRSPEP